MSLGIFFMKKLILWSLVLVSNSVIGQTVGHLHHFQRSWDADSLQMPCEVFDTRDLSIPYPDSLYDAVTINVKNLTWKGVKGFALELKSQNDTVSYIRISVKGKRKGELLKRLDTSMVKTMGCSGKVTKTHTVEGATFRRRKSSIKLEKTS